MGEALAVDLGLDEAPWSGRRSGSASRSVDHRVHVGDELLERPLDLAEVGDQARVLERGRAVRPVDELVGVLARRAEHVADHHRRDVDADVLDQVDAPVRVRLERAVVDQVDDLAHALGVIERALRA